MKENFNLFGFQINTKKFFIVMGIAIGTLLILLGVDALWLDISWYGVLIGTGFLVAIAVACDNAKHRGFNSDFVYDLIWWVFPLSIIGARTYYVVCEWDTFATFWDMIKIWEGGLAIYGGIIGGLLGVIICCLIKKKNIVAAMDLAAPSLIIGQAIGRWGNFVNVEVYGFEVTNKAWQWFPFAVKVGNTYHLATFFYESVLNLAGFFLLLAIIRRNKEKGIVVSTYLFFYGIVRICLESLRIPEYILYIKGTNIPVSSVVSAGIILVGAVWLCTILVRKYLAKKKIHRADKIMAETVPVVAKSSKGKTLVEKKSMPNTLKETTKTTKEAGDRNSNVAKSKSKIAIKGAKNSSENKNSKSKTASKNIKKK